MHANHSETRPSAHTSHTSPVWETTKWIIAIGAVIHICYTLLSAGGVL